MKGELTRIMLNILQNTGYATSEIFDIFTSGYAESYRKLRGIPSPVRTPNNDYTISSPTYKNRDLLQNTKVKIKFLSVLLRKGNNNYKKFKNHLKRDYR